MKFHNYYNYLKAQQKLISEKKWSELSDYDQTHDGEYSVVRNIIKHELLHVEPFTHDVMNAYSRLFLQSETSTWTEIFSHVLPPPPLSTIQFIMQYANIDWNADSVITPILLKILAINNSSIDIKQYLDFFISNGANVNIQSYDCHESILYQYILHSLRSNTYVIRPNKIIDNVTYLLQHGADPLLPDKNGETILSVIKNPEKYNHVDITLKDSLIDLLESYS